MSEQQATSGRIDGRFYSNLGEADLRAALKAVEDGFGTRWLAEHLEHPVGRLWARTDDFLSTNELFWLGYSMVALAAIDKKWVREAVKKIKSSDRGARVGFAFEILALASIALPKQQMTPLSHGTKTFDGDMTLESGARYRVSVKNFGALEKERTFRKNARKMEKRARAIATEQRKNWLGMLVFSEAYPKDKAWEELYAALPAAITNGENTSNGFWTIRFFSNPPSTPNGIAPNELSYNVAVVIPHDASELNAFISKTEKACLELDAAAQKAGKENRCVALIRLSENAPLAACEAWVRTFVADPKRRLHAVILYQSAIANNRNENSTSLHHNIAIVVRPGEATDTLSFSVPVGRVSKNPSKQILIMGEREVPLDACHMHASNEVYQHFEMTEQGATFDTSCQPGSAYHAVVSVPGGESIVFKSQHADHTEVFLFSWDLPS